MKQLIQFAGVRVGWAVKEFACLGQRRQGVGGLTVVDQVEIDLATDHVRAHAGVPLRDVPGRFTEVGGQEKAAAADRSQGDDRQYHENGAQWHGYAGSVRGGSLDSCKEYKKPQVFCRNSLGTGGAVRVR
jgi:hypothetical protein